MFERSRVLRRFSAWLEQESVPGKINILAPVRSVFRHDIEALEVEAPQLNIMKMNAGKDLPTIVLGLHEGMEQRSFFESEQRSREVFSPVYPRLRNVAGRAAADGRLHGFLTANIDYHQDEPLRLLAADLSLPFFVLNKETPLSSVHADLNLRRLNLSPALDRGHILMVGGPFGHIYLDTGATTEDRYFVTGLPRFDRPSKAANPNERNLIVLLPFGREYGVEDDVFQAFVDAVISASVPCGFRVCLKMRDRKGEKRWGRALLERGYSPEQVFTSSENPNRVFSKALIVVGANSTALLEALLGRSEVVNYSPRRDWDLLDLPSTPEAGFHRCMEIGEVLATVREIVDSAQRLGSISPIPVESTEVRRNLVSRCLRLPDETGTNSSHVEDVIVRCVNR